MKRLIGWRTADFLLETADRDQALNWQAHHEILPIFEGDPNTTLKPVRKSDVVPVPRDLLENATNALDVEGWYTTARLLRALLGKEGA
jgi:hypothetical protein